MYLYLFKMTFLKMFRTQFVFVIQSANEILQKSTFEGKPTKSQN